MVDVMALSLLLKEEGSATLKSSLRSLGGEVTKTVAAFASVSYVVNKFVAETREAERVQADLRNALQTTNGISRQTIDSLNEQSKALMAVSAFGDEAIGSAQALLLMFTNIRGEIFERSVPAIMDLATKLRIDLSSAASMVGKALQDPAHELNALNKNTRIFSEEQKKVIQSLTESGRLQEAQGLILEQLESRVGGAAKAYRDTLGGALDALSNNFGNLFELQGKYNERLRKTIEFVNRVVTGWNNILFPSPEKELEQLDKTITKLREVQDRVREGSNTYEEAQEKIQAAQARVNEILAQARAQAKANSEATKQEATVVRTVTEEELKAERERVALLLEYSGLLPAKSRNMRDLLALEKKFTSELNNANTPLARRVELMKQSVTLSDLMHETQVFQLKTKLEDSPATITNSMSAIRNSLLQAGQSRIAGDLQKVSTKIARAHQKVVDETKRAAAALEIALYDTFQTSVQAALVGGILGGIEQAVASGSIGEGFKAMASMMLAGLGDAMIAFGTQSAAFAGLMKTIMDGLAFLSPETSLAAAIALIAMGSALKGVARGMFGGQRGGSASSVRSFGGNNVAPGLPTTQLVFGATSATTGAGINPMTPMHVTVIGPNDPSAQRAIQELMNKANNRGRIG